MILQLENINKHYLQDKLEVPVLKNITFEVEAGEYVAIMGPSGSGKSTLMNILGCLDLPSSGSYHLNGLDVSKLNDGPAIYSENIPNKYPYYEVDGKYYISTYARILIEFKEENDENNIENWFNC